MRVELQSTDLVIVHNGYVTIIDGDSKIRITIPDDGRSSVLITVKEE